MINQLLQCLQAEKDEIIRDVIQLIGFPSVTGSRVENRRALFWLLEKAAQQGMKVSHTQEEDCGVIEIGQGEEAVGILTHVDVVGVGDRHKWQTDPFTGVYDGRWIVGRGAMDDKGPTIVIYTILWLMNQLNLPLKKRIQLIIGTQEESNWEDMAHFRQAFSPPDYGFTPDGAFPVHNMEKGYADVQLTFQVKQSPRFCIDALRAGDSENTIPSSGLLVIKTDTGDQCRRLSRQAQRVIGSRQAKAVPMGGIPSSVSVRCEENRFQLNAKGISSHSSLPQNGVNAISLLVEILAELDQKEQLLHPSFRGVMDFIHLFNGCHDGSTLGFDNRLCLYQGEYMGENIVVPTVLLFEEDKVKLNLNIRHRYGVSLQDLEREFQALTQKYGFTFQIRNYQDPLYVSRHLPFFEKMHQAYEYVTGQKSEFALADGTSYAKALPQMVSWGPVFPGETDTCHQENERIHIESLMKAAEIYARYLVADAVKS
ncbi:Sapep family Mn(2+)-dependent dipeptidase [Anoxynatronum buryatiense]|uniref:Succinyl-diaminopimelate desuccinylase n=1 Tax=Anoxynatronum buryatiense TaxID=489973 RepID=A0AA45WX09_9CLOT|nr:Sapep family Mn(2+)-dependent dipeptidase [Anoxynatronum buryatiense]SMP62559.1 succinyl-diaminopimelate desuccinylase [Anoxynatronum buryatiense]